MGIILCNGERRVLWCKRIGQEAWQFPQGGIRADETPREAMFRELAEETGLRPEHVKVLGATRGWLRYRLPRHLVRRGRRPCCIGQKQVWFLLRFLGEEADLDLRNTDHPEFDGWRWVEYWLPAKEVVFFKRRVYERALFQLAPLLFDEPPEMSQAHSRQRSRSGR